MDRFVQLNCSLIVLPLPCFIYPSSHVTNLFLVNPTFDSGISSVLHFIENAWITNKASATTLL